METIKAWVRGEPITLATLVTAVVALVGPQIAEDKMAMAITVVVYLVGQVVARSKVTPAANPVLPQPKVVDVNDNPVVVTASGALGIPLPPVKSLSGSR